MKDIKTMYRQVEELMVTIRRSWCRTEKRRGGKESRGWIGGRDKFVALWYNEDTINDRIW